MNDNVEDGGGLEMNVLLAVVVVDGNESFTVNGKMKTHVEIIVAIVGGIRQNQNNQ